MSSADTIEIVTQPKQLSENDALKQVQERNLAKLKSAITKVEPVRAVLRYKPFYAYDVTLTKRVFRGENKVTEGRIVADALGDVARPFTAEEVEDSQTTVSNDQLIEPQISKEDAELTANSRRMQVEHRERGNVDMEDEPQLVHKPVWLVELSNGEVRVVDGTDGTVFSDMLLG